MKIIRFLIIALLCAFAQGAWADNVKYMEYHWEGSDTDGQLVSEEKTASATAIERPSSSIVPEAMSYFTLTDGWYYVESDLTYEGRIVIGGDVHIIIPDGVTLTVNNGIQIDGNHTLYLHGQAGGNGNLECHSDNGNSPLGSQHDHACGDLEIHGVNIVAGERNGFWSAAAIGGGENESNGVIKIYDGNITAYGGHDAACIGAGSEANQENPIYIYGGSVYAYCGDYTSSSCGAGIGGGGSKSNGEVLGNGGVVKIYGGNHQISGAIVESNDNDDNQTGRVTEHTSAAIGGGDNGNGGDVSIYGGTVTVDVRGASNLIGAGNQYRDVGSLHIADGLSVTYRDYSKPEKYYDREDACQYFDYRGLTATIAPCSHPGGATYKKYDENKHKVRCSYCSNSTIYEAHTMNDDNVCTKCGYNGTNYEDQTIYESNEDGTGYEEVDKVIAAWDTDFILPECGYVPDNMIFVGWSDKSPMELGNSVIVTDGETLYQPGDAYFIVENNYFSARYKVCWQGNDNGNGTSAKPYIIATTTDLDNLASYVNSGIDYEDKHFCVNADITYDGSANNFTSIGDATHPFKGTFNGNGYTISGISFTGSGSNQGIFGYLASGGTVEGIVSNGINIVKTNAGGTIQDCLYLSDGGNYIVETNGKREVNTVSSGTEGLTLSFGKTLRNYRDGALKACDYGLLYQDKLYTGATQTVTFNITTNGATNVKANGTALTANDDGSYTLYMSSEDVIITAEVSDVTTISLLDGGDNTVVLAEYDGETVNVDYDRELTTGENGESVAYTVCLPYDVDTSENAEDNDDESAAARSRALEEDAEVKVFTLAAVDEENKQFIFTDAPTFIPAGTPVVVVVYKGSVSLDAEAVVINATMLGNGLPVYASFEDYEAQGDNYIGYWTGSYDTFRAFFEALETTEVGTYVPMYQPKDGELQAFPADKFADDFASSTPTGVVEIDNSQLTIDNWAGAWYDLQGRKIANGQKPKAKGLYINNGKIRVIK